MEGVSKCVSLAAPPSPGKCLPQPTMPWAARPARKARAKVITSVALRAGGREPSTSADSGSARSTTGASVVLKPNAATLRAMSSPCSRARSDLPVMRVAVPTAWAEGMGASASRRRFTVPPSTSTQRTPWRAPRPVASLRRALVWRASTMLRRKRMTPPGLTRRSHARSRPLSSVPLRPTTSRLPAASRSVVVIRFSGDGIESCVLSSMVAARAFALEFPLQLLEEIEGLERRERIDVDGFDAIDDALRKRREDGELHGLGCGFGLDALPLLLFMLAQDMLGALDNGSGQACHTSHFDSVALAGGSRLDVVQEDDAVRRFLDAHAQVAHLLQFFHEHGELMVMRGEERAGAGFGVEVFDCGPRKRETIEGRCAAAHLVEQDK